MVRELIAVESSAASSPPIRDKVRLRFRKDASLRWLSHHDLMRTVERMVRRAELPVCRSGGFNPRPRLVYALSLPLGVIGCQEVLEMELDQVLPLEEVRERLFRQAPPGLTFLELRRVPPRTQAQVRRLTYHLPVPDDRLASLEKSTAELLAAGQVYVDRQRPTPRRVDVRPFLAHLQLVPIDSQSREGEAPAEPGPFGSAGASPSRPGPSASQAHLEISLWLLPEGTARPEEILTLLGLGDLIASGVILERSGLEELHDEVALEPAPINPPLTQHGAVPLPGKTLAGAGLAATLPFTEKEEHEERNVD